ncbi:MAG: carboxypeptidase-like regulatory domain-containing protein [Prevotella sp.]|nr:carboxypeptidase-like regulatory domain-containing protein [Prevotella sp.]
MKQLVLYILIMWCVGASAQTFTGTVSGQKKEKLIGANLKAVDANGKMVCFAITNAGGRYTLKVNEGKKVANVVVSYIGYKTKTIPFSKMQPEMAIRLEEGDISLKEVKVKSQRLKSEGDTLTYSVAGFRQAQDRSIADVISKMPGMEVKDNGQVLYNGKAINKFYIEGMDLMGSQYGMANQNLSAKKVKSVQVLKNHQPTKSLRGKLFSEQAALNIVLEEDAKAVWNGCLDAGVGYGDELLYDTRLMGMRFAKKFQSLLLYKNNNTGKDISTELRYMGQGGNEQGLLSMMSIGAPNIERSRYTFNDSHLFAGNWLWKTGADSELRIQGNGFIDKTDMASYRSTTYLNIEGMPIVTEDQLVTNHTSQWNGEVSYKYNGEKTYVNNIFRGNIDFNKSVGTMTTNDVATDMMVKPRKRSLSNALTLSGTNAKGNSLIFNSNTSYNYIPGQLLTINGATELLDISMFNTENTLDGRLRLGIHYINFQAGACYLNNSLDVAIGDAVNEKSTYQKAELFWRPSLDLKFGSHRVSLAAKLAYAHQSYREKSSDDVWVNPSLSWRWEASARSTIDFTGSYETSPLSMNNIFDTPVFTNYRSMKVNRGEPDLRHDLKASVTYRFEDPLSGLFFFVKPELMRSSGSILYQGMLSDDNIYTSKASDFTSTSTMVSLSSRVSKTFSWAKTIIGIGGSVSQNDYEYLIDKTLADGRALSADLSVDYSLRPFQQLSLTGRSEMLYSKQKNRSSNQPAVSTTRWIHNLQLHLLPTEKLMLTLSNDLFHSNEKNFKTSYFCDFTISYNSNSWELSLSLNNIIGTSEYETRTIGTTTDSYSLTRLRPREYMVKLSIDL